jgi:undecaprenyl-diphosphatase
MTALHALILGIVEGLTEFVPVSSTAHLGIASELLRLPQTDFLKSFMIVIQFGAILSVCILFFSLVWKEWKTWVPRIIVAFVPTAVIGFVLYKIIKTFLIGNVLVSGITLLLGGIVFLYIEKVVLPKREAGSEKNGAPGLAESGAVGAAQALAVIPGVSRSGAIIAFGLWRGYSRELVTTFAFLLAVPTMAAASVYDLYKSAPTFTGGDWRLLGIGFLTAFIVAYMSSRWFISFVSKHNFKVFGWYRIFIGAAIILYVILK